MIKCISIEAGPRLLIEVYIVFIEITQIHPIREVVRGIAGRPLVRCEYVGLRKSEGESIIAIRYIPPLSRRSQIIPRS